MSEHVVKVEMPEGFKALPKEEVENLIEKAITILNPDIKVKFLCVYVTELDWHQKKRLDKS